MTVQDLIDELNKIEDKTSSVRVQLEHGRSCFVMSVSDLNIQTEMLSSDNDDVTVIITGVEDPELSEW